jgi:hypothetical protein
MEAFYGLIAHRFGSVPLYQEKEGRKKEEEGKKEEGCTLFLYSMGMPLRALAILLLSLVCCAVMIRRRASWACLVIRALHDSVTYSGTFC